MPSKTIKTPLQVDRYFHIYNKGNNRERIFAKEEDYRYFMQLYLTIVQPFAQTYAYCLLPNHYHFLLKIGDGEPHQYGHPSHLFRKFFQAYAIWFNLKSNRKGSLFTKYYRRIEISNEDYLKHLVYYIHRNPV